MVNQNIFNTYYYIFYWNHNRPTINNCPDKISITKYHPKFKRFIKSIYRNLFKLDKNTFITYKVKLFIFFRKNSLLIKDNWSKSNSLVLRSKEFNNYFNNEENDNFKKAIIDFKNLHTKEVTACATRKASELSLNLISEYFPNLLGGSADLTGSNNTKSKEMKIIDANDFNGSYIHYGVREHAMAGIMNGIALHGGLKPYGGTFLVFSDYCRPSIRLSALMQIPVIYVMTHDSIGLGEDGPTHQPVEHLASLRAIPNLTVIRPCDIIETIEAWQIALQNNGPTVLVLTRQNLPLIKRDYYKNNLLENGAYIILNYDKYDATILASGSEVEIACSASNKLKEQNDLNVRVVSIPSFELFENKNDDEGAQSLTKFGTSRPFESMALVSMMNTCNCVAPFSVSGFVQVAVMFSNSTSDEPINCIVQSISTSFCLISDLISEIFSG